MRCCAILLPLLLLAAGLPVRDPVTIYLTGDSTMAPKQDDQRHKTGWGEAAEMAGLAHEAFMSLTTGRFRSVMPHEPDYDFVVAQDGSGDFTTIQEAIDAVRDYTPIPRTIFIKSGVYREKLLIPSWKTDITLIGEDVESTIIDYDDYAGKGDINTFTSYTARISGDDIRVRDITFRNSAGPVGQALALFVEGDRVLFDNCRFEGDQDTIFAAGEGSRQYFRNSYVEGTTDFIFGPATAYFENCHIHSKRDSYITAASTPQDVPHGFVFVDCKLTAEPDVESVYLGRPWRDYARTIFIASELGAHIRPEGWHDWSRPEARHTTFYAEYGNTGPGAAREGRVSWARVLDAGEAERYTKEEVLCARRCGRVPWYERY